MRIKVIAAAALLAGSVTTAQAGGLLNAEETVAPTAPVVVADANGGGLGGALPFILGGLLIAGALGAGGSGGGS